MIKVSAKCVIKPDAIDLFREITSKLIDETRKEDGCIAYELFQDNEDSTVFMFIEMWENMEKLNLHIQSVHCVAMLPEMEKTFKEDMVLHFMTLVK